MKGPIAACVLLATACGAPPGGTPRSAGAAPPADQAARERAQTEAFARTEEDALDWIAAADPRLAQRAGMPPSATVLERIGTDAVLAEDTAAQIRGGSLDLFAFRAREHALAQAAKTVSAFHDALPDVGPLGSSLARPKLERELIGRLIEEERARTGEEAKLGDASGDLVRGIVSTWTPPSVPQDWPDRDVWVSKHLLEIRDSLRQSGPRTGPPDLDVALYPLERLLAPLQFPRGAAAIARVRMTIDEDMRSVPQLVSTERVIRAARIHLGVTVDPAAERPRLERIEARLRELAQSALLGSGDGRADVEGRARDLLVVERPCPAVSDSRVRSMAPPPERAAVCGVVRALSEEPARGAAVVALHDGVLLSMAALSATPPPRTGLLSHPADDEVDALERTARERPVVLLGVAIAAELLYDGEGLERRLDAWRALGEAPLDVVAREIGAAAALL